MRLSMLLLLTCFLLATPASAYEITLTFDEIGASGCDQIWYEKGLPMYVTTPVEPECGSSCYEGIAGSGEVFMANGTLRIDLSSLADLTSIEVDGTNGGGGFYVAVLENGDPKLTVEDDYSTVLDVNGVVFDELRVNSCEGSVSEIRLFGAGVSTWEGSWGCVKALF